MGELANVSIPDPDGPQTEGCKSVTTDWAYHVGSSSGQINTVVMTLFVMKYNVRSCFVLLLPLACSLYCQCDMNQSGKTRLTRMKLYVDCGTVSSLFSRLRLQQSIPVIPSDHDLWNPSPTQSINLSIGDATTRHRSIWSSTIKAVEYRLSKSCNGTLSEFYGIPIIIAGCLNIIQSF